MKSNEQTPFLRTVNASRGVITRAGAALCLSMLGACSQVTPPVDASTRDIGAEAQEDVTPRDRQWFPEATVPDGAAPDGSIPDAGPPTGYRTRIEHVVIIAQENHTFDAYFGRYCRAPTGSNPTCTDGPNCCEAAPAMEPSGSGPRALDDTANGDYDPNHSYSCEISEQNGGAMDQYVRGTSCSDAKNFAIAPDSLMTTYHGYAREGALADRYFQPVVGSTSSNDMYFAVAKFVFRDNDIKPRSVGQGCLDPRTTASQFSGETTIGDVLINAGYTFSYYHEGYARMRASNTCPSPPSDCRSALWPLSPCNYDASDNPFQYYRQFTDNPLYMRDVTEFLPDLQNGKLPTLSFIKFSTYHNEHPGWSTYISDGVRLVDQMVTAVKASPFANNTLIIFTVDEGGGYFDHITPPPVSMVDNQPYGTRIPMVAIGRFAKRNYVSHQTMEHSSILRFIEWNFTGATGQLRARDAVVNSIGDLLDPTQVGQAIP